MLLDSVLLLASLALLLASAKIMIDGVSGIAAAVGVPELVIGMTVVAFGTSTPELVINALSASRGSTDLAFGNVIGSCLVNVGFVLAVTAIVKPLRVEPSIITREIPMLLVGVAAIVVLGSDELFDGVTPNVWRRSDGFILLLLFAIFLYYTTRQAIAARRTDPFMAEVKEQAERTPAKPLWRQALLAVAGLVGVSIGAELTVEHAVALARAIAVPETIIGLTIISLGTTLPELATCILAARRGNPDIAVGNIVGSNIFNLLFIGGIVSTIERVHIPPGGNLDMSVMGLLSVVLLPIAIRSQRTITRGEGVFLLVLFSAYLIWRISHG
jgi:cation:H+ antiporter